MGVTATFLRDPIEVVPGAPATVTLRLHNDGVTSRVVELAPTGELAEHTALDTVVTTMETNQIVDVGVTIDLAATFEAGPHTLTVELAARASSTRERATADATRSSIGSSRADLDNDTGASATDAAAAIPTDAAGTADDVGDAVDVERRTVAATVEVVAVTSFAIRLRPERSRGSTSGRHRVQVANAGNVAVTVELQPSEHGPDIGIDAPAPSVTVAPGGAGQIELRVTPTHPYWSGPATTHEFTLRTEASDGSTEELTGTFEQRPRVPNWVGPAAAGALAALVIGAVVWFAFLAPWVEDTADDAAADALERDREALQIRIDELETAAAEAEELPLGIPTDLRLSVAPTGGNTESASEAVERGQRLSVTDVILQNPTGAVGTVSLLRDDDVLLESELANFRDFDLHFVAPYVFEESSEIVLEVACRTPGTGASDCPVSASIIGFVDEAN